MIVITYIYEILLIFHKTIFHISRIASAQYTLKIYNNSKQDDLLSFTGSIFKAESSNCMFTDNT